MYMHTSADNSLRYTSGEGLHYRLLLLSTEHGSGTTTSNVHCSMVYKVNSLSLEEVVVSLWESSSSEATRDHT